MLNQHLPCLQLLLAAGADPDPGPAKGLHKKTSLRPETPLAIARRSRAEAAAALPNESLAGNLYSSAALSDNAGPFEVALLEATEAKTRGIEARSKIKGYK